MRRLALRTTCALLAAAPALGLAGPSFAAEETQISHVEPDGDSVRILVSVPEGAEPELDGVTVTVAGADALASAETAEGATVQVERTAVLALDTSDSMRGDRFAAAIVAAERFLDVVPPDVRVGIVTFNSEVTTTLDPTTDRDAAREAIDGLSLSRGTLVYDGAIAAIALAGDEGQRQVLVLSDGANTNATTIQAVTAALEESEVRLDAVALDQTPAASKRLQEITDAGSGTVISADPAALSAAFTAEADSLARQLLVTAELPASVTASEATLEVTLPDGSGTLTASAFSKIRERGAEPAPEIAANQPDRVIEIPRHAMYAGLTALGLGLMILLGSFLSMAAGGRAPATVEERINAFGGEGHTAGSRKAEKGSTLDSAKAAASSMLQRNRGLEARIEARLEAAGSPLKAAEWLLLHGMIAILSGLVGFLLGGGPLLLLGVGLGTAVPWLWLGHKRKKRIADFNSGLADTLQLISGSLSAGMSLAQSIDSVVNEGREPIAGEFKRVLIETRLGVPLEAALEGIAQRVQSKDFAWVVMAIRIQREVGGNLAELLNTVAGTLRERDYLRRQVRSLSAEGRLSAYILIALPIGMIVYLLALRRDYIMPMFETGFGLLMLGAAVVLLCLGWFMMSRIVKVEV